MKLKIPKTYRLGATKCVVELVEKIECDDKIIMGDWDCEHNKIRLATKSSTGSEVSDDRLGHTYCHELVHSILDAMGHKLSNDEGFVDAFGKYLHQYLVSQSGVLRVLDE